MFVIEHYLLTVQKLLLASNISCFINLTKITSKTDFGTHQFCLIGVLLAKSILHYFVVRLDSARTVLELDEVNYFWQAIMFGRTVYPEVLSLPKCATNTMVMCLVSP